MYDSSDKAWPDTEIKHTTGKSKPKLVSGPILSESYTKVSRSAINLKIVVFIRFCMADKLNGQGLPVRHTEPCENRNFQNDSASRYFGV